MQDEWIIGQSIDGERDYALHLRTPRFIVEIVSQDDGSIRPVEVEFLDDDDAGDAGDAEQHMRDAADAFIEWERRLEEEIEDEAHD